MPTLVRRRTGILSATAVNLNLKQTGQLVPPRGFFIRNLSAPGVTMYVADETTAGTPPTISTNITVDCTHYLTIPSGERAYFATENPNNVFVQVSTGSAGVAQTTPVI
jgi:hypothetical protein